MPQRVGAYGYAMQFTIDGFDDLVDQKWRVVITRPNGTSLERLSDDGDVTILDLGTKTMGVRIKSGDFSVPGAYELQVWNETEPGSNLRSSVRIFSVLESLVPPSS